MLMLVHHNNPLSLGNRTTYVHVHVLHDYNVKNTLYMLETILIFYVSPKFKKAKLKKKHTNCT